MDPRFQVNHSMWMNRLEQVRNFIIGRRCQQICMAVHLLFYVAACITFRCSNSYEGFLKNKSKKDIYYGLIASANIGGSWLVGVLIWFGYSRIPNGRWRAFSRQLFLAFCSITFPVIAAIHGEQFSNVLALITLILLSLSIVFALVTFRLHEDFGISDCLIAIALASLTRLSAKQTLWKCIAIGCIGALKHLISPLIKYLSTKLNPAQNSQDANNGAGGSFEDLSTVGNIGDPPPSAGDSIEGRSSGATDWWTPFTNFLSPSDTTINIRDLERLSSLGRDLSSTTRSDPGVQRNASYFRRLKNSF